MPSFHRALFVPSVALAAFAAAFAAACGGSLDATSPEPVTGTGEVYALATTDDINIPASFISEGRTVEVRKGALTLGPDSTFIFSLALRSSANGTQPANGTVTIRGAFHRSGTALALVQQASDTLFAGTYTTSLVSLLRGKASVVGDRYTFSR
ncbi:MAG: hypothetical protein IT359_21255 [Gemmatimonadaceae bacterium]|nr:hypothetical protein [Gemmatimonadaceae bacterium]